MTDRADRLEAALRAEDALIVEAQAEIMSYLMKEIGAQELVNRLIRVFDGPGQREAQRLAQEAFTSSFGFD
jgi:hypothetical protein